MVDILGDPQVRLVAFSAIVLVVAFAIVQLFDRLVVRVAEQALKVAKGRLLYRVGYHTGAESRYSYRPATVGGTALTYFVTRQTLSDSGFNLRSNRFTYEVVNGHVVFAEVTHFSYGAVEEGSTVHTYDVQGGAVTQSIREASGSVVTKSRTWFGSGGVERAIGETSAFPAG